MIPQELIDRLQHKKPMSAYKGYELVFPNAPLLLGIEDFFDWEHPLFLVTGVSFQAKSNQEGIKYSQLESFIEEVGHNPRLPRQRGLFLKGQLLDSAMNVAESDLILEKCQWKNWYLVDDFPLNRST